MSENLTAVRELSGEKSFQGKQFIVNCTFGATPVFSSILVASYFRWCFSAMHFYTCDAMLARVFATATCPSVCLSHVGIVPSRAKAGS